MRYFTAALALLPLAGAILFPACPYAWASLGCFGLVNWLAWTDKPEGRR